jgi:hypothetical protein
MSLEDSPGECVSALAKAAGLPLPSERVAQVEAVLTLWRADARRLARRMSEARFDNVLPVTVFSHGATPEGEAP